MREVESRMVSSVLFGLWAVSLMGGCDREEAGDSRVVHEQPDSLPEQVEIEVDGESVYYVTFDADGEKHPADDIGDIPLVERGAVGVHVSGDMPEEMVGRRVYSTGLFGVDSGDRVRANLTEFGTFRNRSQAGSMGGREAASVYSKSRSLAEGTASVTDGSGENPSSVSSASGVDTAGDDSQGGRRGGGDEIVIESIDDLRTAGGSDQGGNFIEVNRGSSEVNRGSSESVPGRMESDDQERKGYYPVVVYGADWCKVCRKAKTWLNTHDVSYQWRDIEESREAKEEMNRFCRKNDLKPGAIPTIRIIREDEVGGDEVIQGWSAETFRRLARR